MEQLLQMNENEQDLQWLRPRSHSLPNNLFQEGTNDDWIDEDSDYDGSA